MREDERMLRPRRRAWPIALAVTLTVLIVLAGAALALGETLARPAIERAVAAELDAALPAGSAPATVTVTGGPVVLQVLSGALDLRLRVPGILVRGARVDAEVTADGVPVDRSRPVREASGVFTVDEVALNALIVPNSATGPITIGAGTVRYEREGSVFGRRVGFAVAFAPELRGDELAFTPVSLEATSPMGGAGALDLSEFIDASEFAFSFCVAELLPEGVRVTGVSAEPGRITVTAAATGLSLDAASLARTGRCG